MESHEVEELIARTLIELDHPRVAQVQTFTERKANRTGVHVRDTDSSEGFVQVVK